MVEIPSKGAFYKDFYMTTSEKLILKTLSDQIKDKKIPAARISSAQAKGSAKKYPYWGVVRYEIRVSKTGLPCLYAKERASSDRRSLRLAEKDLDAICEKEQREPVMGGPGTLSVEEAVKFIKKDNLKSLVNKLTILSFSEQLSPKIKKLFSELYRKCET